MGKVKGEIWMMPPNNSQGLQTCTTFAAAPCAKFTGLVSNASLTLTWHQLRSDRGSRRHCHLRGFNLHGGLSAVVVGLRVIIAEGFRQKPLSGPTWRPLGWQRNAEACIVYWQKIPSHLTVIHKSSYYSAKALPCSSRSTDTPRTIFAFFISLQTPCVVYSVLRQRYYLRRIFLTVLHY